MSRAFLCLLLLTTVPVFADGFYSLNNLPDIDKPPADWVNPIRTLSGDFLSTDNPLMLLLYLEAKVLPKSVVDQAAVTVGNLFLRVQASLTPEMTPLQKLQLFDRVLRQDFHLEYGETLCLSDGLARGVLDCDTGSYLYLGFAHEAGWPLKGIQAPGHYLILWDEPDNKFYFETTAGKETDLETLITSSGVNIEVKNNGGFFYPNPSESLASNFYSILGTFYMDSPEPDGLRIALDFFNRSINLFPRTYYALQHRSTVYVRMKDLKSAIRDLSTCIDMNPNSNNALYRRGLLYQETGEYRKCVDDLRQVIMQDSTHADVYYIRSVAYKNLGLTDEADRDLSRALKLRPDDVEFLDEYGVRLLRMGKITDALAVYQKILCINPNDFHSRVSIATITNTLGKPMDMNEIDALIECIPSSRDSLYWLGFLQFLKADSVCIGTLKKALLLYPDDWETRISLATAMVKWETGQEVEDIVNSLIIANPGNINGYTLRAEFYCKAGAYEKAITDLKAAYFLKPLPEITIAMAMVLKEMGRNEEGIELLNDEIARTPGNTDLIRTRAELFWKSKDYRNAYTDYRVLCSESPEDADCWERKGYCEYSLHKYTDAIDSYSKVVSLSPDNTNVACICGRLFLIIGDYPRAIEAFESLPDGNQDLLAKFYLALAYIKVGRADAALEIVNTRQMYGFPKDVYEELADLYGTLELYQRSDSLFTNAIAMATDDESRSSALAKRGRMRQRWGRDSLAIADYTVAIELDSTNAIALMGLATNHHQNGDNPGAEILFASAIREDPELSELFYERGLFYLDIGETKKARLDFLRALELSPSWKTEIDKVMPGL